MDSEPVLEARRLEKHFARSLPALFRPRVPEPVVSGVDLTVCAGETLGLVGESGSGKSTFARLLLGLLAPTSGQVLFRGQDLATLRGPARRAFRRAVQAVFQDPFGSLNPRLRVGYLVAETLIVGGGRSREDIRTRVRELLGLVGLPISAADRYPHEFSGGQRQRIAIARSLASSPEVIILDEPVSSLDVSIQGQVLNLLRDLQDRFSVGYLLITHDLAVAEHMCQRVAVLYRGRIVELLPANRLNEAAHPYTRALLASVPPLDLALVDPNEATASTDAKTGCAFRARCPHARPTCVAEVPALRDIAPGRAVACHLHEARVVIDDTHLGGRK